MDRDSIVAQLQAHAPEIRKPGVAHVHLFGSAARNEMRPDSDVDLMVEFDGTTRITLLTLAGLQQDLSDLLGTNADLSAEKWIHEHVRVNALRDAYRAF